MNVGLLPLQALILERWFRLIAHVVMTVHLQPAGLPRRSTLRCYTDHRSRTRAVVAYAALVCLAVILGVLVTGAINDHARR